MATIGAWWLAAQPAREGERVVTSWRANRTQGGRAVGGALHLTDQRLVFCPNKIDNATGRHAWTAELADVTEVGTAARTGNPFDGGLRTRLAIGLADGTRTLFVVNGLEEVRAAVTGALGR